VLLSGTWQVLCILREVQGGAAVWLHCQVCLVCLFKVGVFFSEQSIDRYIITWEFNITIHAVGVVLVFATQGEA
jgi:hypothetical protein